MFLQEVGVGIMHGIFFEENEGAIFLAKNSQVGMPSKHIICDVPLHLGFDQGLLTRYCVYKK